MSWEAVSKVCSSVGEHDVFCTTLHPSGGEEREGVDEERGVGQNGGSREPEKPGVKQALGSSLKHPCWRHVLQYWLMASFNA
jgi:hypothetical protein